jgi:hypothetical protein
MLDMHSCLGYFKHCTHPSRRCGCAGLTEAEQVVTAALGQQLGLGSRTQQAEQRQTSDSSPSVTETDGSSGNGVSSLSHCRLLNISVCEQTVSASRAGRGFRLALYNPLAWRRTHYVRVPVAGGASWAVTGAGV